MDNPKSTIAGYFGLIGTLLATIGAAFPSKPWAQMLLALGLALNGANGIGNIASKDGSH